MWMQCSQSQQHQSQGHDQGLLFKDKDFSSKDKDKDCIVKDKDQDKDCILVLKESLRTRTNITENSALQSTVPFLSTLQFLWCDICCFVPPCEPAAALLLTMMVMMAHKVLSSLSDHDYRAMLLRVKTDWTMCCVISYVLWCVFKLLSHPHCGFDWLQLGIGLSLAQTRSMVITLLINRYVSLY